MQFYTAYLSATDKILKSILTFLCYPLYDVQWNIFLPNIFTNKQTLICSNPVYCIIYIKLLIINMQNAVFPYLKSSIFQNKMEESVSFLYHLNKSKNENSIFTLIILENFHNIILSINCLGIFSFLYFFFQKQKKSCILMLKFALIYNIDNILRLFLQFSQILKTIYYS